MSTPARKYWTPAYRRARGGWVAPVAAGEVSCHLCGRLIVGPFDLDHVRGGGGVLHPSHPSCNRSEGAKWRGKRRLGWGSSDRRFFRGMGS
jgi:hypothetical protein